MSAESSFTFAERLAALRLKAGLNKAQLADRAGLSRQALTHLERGDREPTFETAVKLAQALGVPVTEFVPQPLANPRADPILPTSTDPTQPS